MLLSLLERLAAALGLRRALGSNVCLTMAGGCVEAPGA